MVECPHCFRVFRDTPENIGARCPKCRSALYENPKRRRDADPTLGRCKEHPRLDAVAVCARCRTPLCGVCRTRWHGDVSCTSCVQESVVSDEPSPKEIASQRSLAWFSFVLALAGWLMILIAFFPLVMIARGQSSATPFLGVLLFGSMFPAVFALAQSISALRLRGQHHPIASMSLGFAGSHLGLLVGMLLLSYWHN